MHTIEVIAPFSIDVLRSYYRDGKGLFFSLLMDRTIEDIKSEKRHSQIGTLSKKYILSPRIKYKNMPRRLFKSSGINVLILFRGKLKDIQHIKATAERDGFSVYPVYRWRNSLQITNRNFRRKKEYRHISSRISDLCLNIMSEEFPERKKFLLRCIAEINTFLKSNFRHYRWHIHNAYSFFKDYYDLESLRNIGNSVVIRNLCNQEKSRNAVGDIYTKKIDNNIRTWIIIHWFFCTLLLSPQEEWIALTMLKMGCDDGNL